MWMIAWCLQLYLIVYALGSNISSTIKTFFTYYYMIQIYLTISFVIVIIIGISLLDTLIGFSCLLHATTNTTLTLDEILEVG